MNIAILDKATSTSTNVPRTEIRDILSLYKLEHRYLEAATFENGVLFATFKIFKYPYSDVPVYHFTREHAVLFITQAAYVLGGQLAKNGTLSPVTIDDYLACIPTENLTFRSLAIHFKRQFSNRQGISIQIRLETLKKTTERLIGRLRFEFERGQCYGTCNAVMTHNIGTLSSKSF